MQIAYMVLFSRYYIIIVLFVCAYRTKHDLGNLHPRYVQFMICAGSVQFRSNPGNMSKTMQIIRVKTRQHDLGHTNHVDEGFMCLERHRP